MTQTFEGIRDIDQMGFSRRGVGGWVVWVGGWVGGGALCSHRMEFLSSCSGCTEYEGYITWQARSDIRGLASHFAKKGVEALPCRHSSILDLASVMAFAGPPDVMSFRQCVRLELEAVEAVRLDITSETVRDDDVG